MTWILAVVGLVLTMPAITSAQPAPVTPLATEPRVLQKLMERVEARTGGPDDEPSEGFFVEMGQMITGSGWISAGPGYRRYVLGRQALLATSAAISWRAYKVVQATIEVPRLADGRLLLGAKALWHDYTQVRYFGAGPDTTRDDVSDYRLQATNIVGYATWRPRARFHVAIGGGWIDRPQLSASAGAFDRSDPDALQLHAPEPGASLTQQPRFVHGDLSVTYDTRDQRSYPRRGIVVRGAWSTYRDQPRGRFGFDRYETEGAYFQPVLGRGVLAAHIWGVFSATAEGEDVPFYLLPSLGGHNTLRSFADYRFHDRHLLAANVETRWALFEHVDAAVFFDAGNVAARVRDLNLRRTSVGVGLRLHTKTTTLARLDTAYGAEGWRLMFKLSDPLRMGRTSKRTAALPFVP